MLAIAAGDTGPDWLDAVIADHTESYAAGWRAAVDHFAGDNTPDTDYAYRCGLIDAYAGYYGQASWEHPVELPGSAEVTQ